MLAPRAPARQDPFWAIPAGPKWVECGLAGGPLFTVVQLSPASNGPGHAAPIGSPLFMVVQISQAGNGTEQPSNVHRTPCRILDFPCASKRLDSFTPGVCRNESSCWCSNQKTCATLSTGQSKKTAASAVHQRCGASWPARPALEACVRLDAVRLEVSRPSTPSARTGPALRGWPGPGPVVRDGRQRGPPGLRRKLASQALRSIGQDRPGAESCEDGQNLARSCATAASAVHRHCGASWPARPALEACAARCSPAATVQALRSIAQGRTGAERMARTWPGRARWPPARSARARSTCAPRCAPARSGQSGPPALRRKLAGQARARNVCGSMQSGCNCPGPPFNRPGQDRR